MALNIYGQHDRPRVADQVARVYAVPQRSLRTVAVEPLTGGRKTEAIRLTCHGATAARVFTWYAMRRSAEKALHDAKYHLDFEEPQN